MFEASWIENADLTMALRLLFAAICGGIVGMERGSGDRPAGFRTHILVCVGSALFMLVSMYGFDVVDADFNMTMVEPRRDSARIAAQVVSGIGFLGAGTILHEGLTIKGLTTAASLWIVSAIGLAVGSGMYLVGMISTVLTLITLTTFHSWEKRFSGLANNDRSFVRVVAENRTQIISDITEYMTKNGLEPRSLEVRKNKLKNKLTIDLYLKVPKSVDTMEIIRGLQGVDGVENIKDSL